MRAVTFLSIALAAFCVSTISTAQEMEMPTPSEEHAVLKHDVGTWDAVITMTTPAGEETAPGREVVSMIGDFWVNGVFTMETPMGPFMGQGTTGYDAESKKYVGSWVDAFSPAAMHMVGTWDADSRTMTMMTTGKNPDGSDKKGKIVTVYSEDGNTRMFTMFDQSPDGGDKMVKSMEIKYTRVADESSKSEK